MKITLPAWGNAWTEFSVDTETGAWSRRLTNPTKAPKVEATFGFASLEPVWGFWRRFYAFYAFDGRLFFQAGRKRWDITEGVESSKFWFLGYGAASGLLLTFKNGEDHRSTLIHPWKMFLPVIDPTYDGIDMESDNFFLFLRTQIPREKWRKAFIDRSLGRYDSSA